VRCARLYHQSTAAGVPSSVVVRCLSVHISFCKLSTFISTVHVDALLIKNSLDIHLTVSERLYFVEGIV
jgi:hypothetical protein